MGDSIGDCAGRFIHLSILSLCHDHATLHEIGDIMGDSIGERAGQFTSREIFFIFSRLPVNNEIRLYAIFARTLYRNFFFRKDRRNDFFQKFRRNDF